jgi:hypothetical protein
MPILPEEPSTHPEDLFDHDLFVSERGRKWRLAHTRPRQEKVLARFLRSREIPYFMPCSQKRHIIRGKMFISFLPIFPGYLFIYADDEEHHVGVTCRHAASLQVVPDQVQFDADIRQVRKLIACGAAVTAEDKLAPGMAVEIKHGPLKGLSGTILSSVSGKRFVVVVNFLRQGASVMLDDAMLAKVS